MTVYPVLNMGALNTVERFLAQPSLTPPIQNPSVAIPQLIQCQGIVHYTRSGTRTAVNAGTFSLQEGDFLVTATQCATGGSYTIPATFVPTDYAFVMGDTGEFYVNAKNFMVRRPITAAMDNRTSLHAVIRTLCTGNQITTAIRNVFIVAHANAAGVLFFKLDENSVEAKTYLDQLCVFVNTPSRTQISTRVINNQAATGIHIRGCNIGKEVRYLRLLRQIFGSQVAVTAPKHFSYFLNFRSRDSSVDVKYEIMEYDFSVWSKARIPSRNDLLDKFVDKQFSDIDGASIPREKFDAWILSNIHTTSRRTTHTCTNPIHAELSPYVYREYKYRLWPVYTWAITYDANATVPVSDADKLADLRRSLGQAQEMQNNWPSRQCNFPMYERFGYTSFDDMVDSLMWRFNWNPGRRTMTCDGKRHEYQIRVPITDSGNNLLVNVVPSSGNRQFIRNDIVETDSRLFGRASDTPAAPRRTDDGL